MSRKVFLTFLLGVLSSGAVFGAILWSQQQKQGLAVLPLTPPAFEQTVQYSSPTVPTTVSPMATAATAAPEVRSQATYEVKSGDNLTRIAKENKTTVGLIKRINSLSSDMIRPGMKLQVPSAPFSVVVDKSQNILTLKSGEEVVKVYTVSTGKNNSTPVGVFKITDRLVNPTWYKAGAVVPPDSPENVLGTRWLGIDKPSYGIHGTVEPEKLGQQVTEGCVRMKNEEVEELFDYLPTGAEVTIID